MIHLLIPLVGLIAIIEMALIRRRSIRQARMDRLLWITDKPAVPILSLVEDGTLLNQVLVGAALGIIGLAIWP
jgi:hypothetical protein